jgi:hypothetical protein
LSGKQQIQIQQGCLPPRLSPVQRSPSRWTQSGRYIPEGQTQANQSHNRQHAFHMGNPFLADAVGRTLPTRNGEFGKIAAAVKANCVPKSPLALAANAQLS